MVPGGLTSLNNFCQLHQERRHFPHVPRSSVSAAKSMVRTWCDSRQVYVYTRIYACIAAWKWEGVNVPSYLLQVCSGKQPKVIISFIGNTEEIFKASTCSDGQSRKMYKDLHLVLVLQILARKTLPLEAELPKLSERLFHMHNTENVITMVSAGNCQRWNCLESLWQILLKNL